MSSSGRKPRILLIHPLGYNPEGRKTDISRLANIMPPLGLISIAAWMEKHGIETEIADCHAYPQSDEDIRKAVSGFMPDFAGFSCTTSSFLDGIRIANIVKTTKSDTKVIFGGPHVSALKMGILEFFPVVDFVVAGEGEDAVKDLIEKFPHINGVKGLIFRDEDKIIFNGDQTGLMDLDSLPFPAYEKLKGFPEHYKLPIFNYPKTPNASIVTSRGCVYECSYCDRSVFRKSFRFNSAEYIFEHIKFLKRNYGIKHINFYDDNFTLNRNRIDSLCRLLIDSGIHITFNCAVRPELIDKDLLKNMKSAGCWMVSMGIESGSEDLLSNHRQNVKLDSYVQKIKMTRKAGMRVKGLFMIGLPGETEKSINDTIKFIKKNPLDEINISKFTPFPGSPIYKNISEHGDFEEDWTKMDCMHFQFVPMGFTKERLQELFTESYKSYFKKPRTLFNYISMIYRSPDSWLRFIGNAGDYIRFAKTDKRIS